MSIFYDAIGFLDKIGVFDVFLPWLLAYAIVKGVLDKIQLFGKDTKAENINTIIAFSIATMFIGSINIARGLRELIPLVVMFIIILISLVIVLATFYVGPKSEFEFGGRIRIIFGIAAGGIFVIIVFYALNLWGVISEMFISTGAGGVGAGTNWNEIIGTAIVLLIMGGIIKWIAGGGPKQQRQQQQSQS